MPRKKKVKLAQEIVGGAAPGDVRNPNGTPENLIPGGTRKGPNPITIDNIPERWEQFCRRYVIENDCSRANDAAEFAGFSPEYGGHLLEHPVIKKRIAQIKETYDMVRQQYTAEGCAIDVFTKQLFEQILLMVARSGPHEIQGFRDVVQAVKLLAEAKGWIGGRGINIQNNNSATVAVSLRTELPDLFIPPWKQAMIDAETTNGKLEAGEPSTARLPG